MRRYANITDTEQIEEMAEWRRQGEALSAKEALSANGETYACQQVNSAFQVSNHTILMLDWCLSVLIR